MDPIASGFSFYSPYQFAGNKPITSADLDGMEEWMKTQESQIKQKAQLDIERSNRPKAMLSTYNPANRTFTQKWRDSKGILCQITYYMANGVYTLPQQLTANIRKSDYLFNLGGNEYPARGIWGENERVNNFVNEAILFVPGAAEVKAE